MLDARLRCDAIVLVAPRLPEKELRQLLALLKPAVVINRARDGVTPAVGVDYGAGVTSIIDHLVSLGHRDVLYLAGRH